MRHLYFGAKIPEKSYIFLIIDPPQSLSSPLTKNIWPSQGHIFTWAAAQISLITKNPSEPETRWGKAIRPKS
jgi:hypothetical protein